MSFQDLSFLSKDAATLFICVCTSSENLVVCLISPLTRSASKGPFGKTKLQFVESTVYSFWKKKKKVWRRQVGESLMVNYIQGAQSTAASGSTVTGWAMSHPPHHFNPPRVAEGWQGTGVSEKLQGCSKLEILKHPSVKFVVICALQFKTLLLVYAWGYEVENPEEGTPPLKQGCNWQLCEVVAADCQTDPHATTWGILRILRLAFPPLAIIHFTHESWKETYGRD